MLLRREKSQAKAGDRSLEVELGLGRHIGGDRAFPVRGGEFCWPVSELRRHAAVFGQSGAGKTETALRIVYELARRTDDQVFFLDPKGSRRTAERFFGLMKELGRRPRVFPNEPVDVWRGDWRGISNRLLEVVSYATDGPASYYRDVAKTALQLACRWPEGEPRSSAELLDRLVYRELARAHAGSTALGALNPELVDQVRMRYEAFFGQLGTALDGDWSFDDVDSAYFLLDAVSLGEDARGSASMLFSDFAHYFKERKPSGRGCVLVIDEFGAVASSSDVAMKVEQAREFEAGLVLLPQTPFGMGGVEQRERILGAIGTVVTHSSNEPEEIAAMAGTVKKAEVTHRMSENQGPSGYDVRSVEVPRLPADEVRALRKGEVWVIRGGRAGKVAVTMAPEVSSELPDPVEHDRRPRRIMAPPVKGRELPY